MPHLVQRTAEQATRDRAILVIRLATYGTVLSALGVSWLFSNLAEAYFSGKPPAPPAPSTVPAAAIPVQRPPKVITKVVVHHSYRPGSVAPGSGPRPPGQGPGQAPAPPPKPVCHSTPSHPC
jgi:hypothetical protein